MRRKLHQFQDFAGFACAFGAWHAAQFQRFTDDIPDRHARVEGTVRVLETICMLAAKQAHRVFAKRKNIVAVEDNFARVGTIRRSSKRPVVLFAAPTFADKPQHFALPHRNETSQRRARHPSRHS
jgi:hypothetical protein